MDSLAAQINSVLAQYTNNVNEDLDQVMKAEANECKDKLRQTSPTDSGSYAKGWSVKKKNGCYIVHNKTDYQLTHLLEKGHDVVAYGKKVGHVNPKVHIKPVEEWVQDDIIKKLEDKLSNDN